MTVLPFRRDSRSLTVGGSDAAAAAGIDPWCSRVMLWLEKTGRVERRETEAMAWGTALEPLIWTALEDRGYDLFPADADGLADPEREWLIGHPDGFTVVNEHRAVLELKTAGAFAFRAGWDDAPPVQYVAQAQLYMHLTGCLWTLVAVLVGGQRLDVFEVRRDERAIRLLLEAAERFHWHLVTDTAPPPDGSDSAREALLALYPQARPESVVRLLGDDWKALLELRHRKAQLAALKALISPLENQLRAAMGDAELALSPHDAEVIRYTNVTTPRVDVTRLKRDRPEIAAEYATESQTRRFRVL